MGGLRTFTYRAGSRNFPAPCSRPFGNSERAQAFARQKGRLGRRPNLQARDSLPGNARRAAKRRAWRRADRPTRRREPRTAGRRANVTATVAAGRRGRMSCPAPAPISPAAVARGLRMTTWPAAMPRGGNRVASFTHDARPNIFLLFRIAATNASARWKRPPAYQLFVAVTGLRAFADRRDRGDCRTGDGGTPRIG